MRHQAKFHADIYQTVAEIWKFNGFQTGGCPPSWICCTLVWTIREEYMVGGLYVKRSLTGAHINRSCGWRDKLQTR